MLHIINNYTGDRMAFDMGRELSEADGVKVGTVIVDDDVSVKDSTYTVGRRGVAGNFFVIKALGAASERGDDLESLVALGERVNSVTRSMGVALSSCTPPAKGSPLFELGDDEIEVGIGIHGEPGRRREKMSSANEIADGMLEAIVSDLPYESGDEVAVMVNGLGGTPISELYLLYGHVHESLEQQRHQAGALLRRRVLHVAGDGGRVAHAGAPGRRAQGAALRARRDRGADLLTRVALRRARRCEPAVVRRQDRDREHLLDRRGAADVVALDVVDAGWPSAGRRSPGR